MRSAIWLFVSLVCWQVVPSSSLACSTLAPTPALVGVPSDGAVEVPTDVILHYVIPIAASVDPADSASVPGSFRLVASNGEEVELSVSRVAHWYFDVTPAHLLTPHTTYWFHASWSGMNLPLAEDELSFETAEGPLTELPAPPNASITHFVLDSDYSSRCGPNRYGSCVSVTDDHAWLEYAYDLERDAYSERGSFMVKLSGFQEGTRTQCIDVRTRALNGAHSEAVRVCSADGPTQDLRYLHDVRQVSCTSEGLAWVGTPDSGIDAFGHKALRGRTAAHSCALSSPAAADRSRASAGMFASLLLLVVVRSRRRSSAGRARINASTHTRFERPAPLPWNETVAPDR